MLAFWREAGPKKWFTKDAAFDDAIRARFLADLRGRRRGQARRLGEHAPKARSRSSSCSTSFRATCSAAARAPSRPTRWRAQVADRAIAKGFDQQVPARERQFFYLPFDAFGTTRRPGALRRALPRDSATPRTLKWAELHADIIRKFGRFPHRNAVLGRATTAEEQAFLDGGGFAG